MSDPPAVLLFLAVAALMFFHCPSVGDQKFLCHFGQPIVFLKPIYGPLYFPKPRQLSAWSWSFATKHQLVGLESRC